MKIMKCLKEYLINEVSKELVSNAYNKATGDQKNRIKKLWGELHPEDDITKPNGVDIKKDDILFYCERSSMRAWSYFYQFFKVTSTSANKIKLVPVYYEIKDGDYMIPTKDRIKDMVTQKYKPEVEAIIRGDQIFLNDILLRLYNENSTKLHVRNKKYIKF